MTQPKFILSKSKLISQVKKLKDLDLEISYSYKTNKEVGKVLQDLSDVDFSIHAREEFEDIKDKKKIWFFTQAQSRIEFSEILDIGIKNFVIDNEIDLENLLKVCEEKRVKINLSLRMKFREHRIGTGKYFVYGMNSKRVNEIILRIKDNKFIEKLGVHIHRKSQNTSEWEIKREIIDSLNKESLEEIDFLNLGGGLPTKYKSYNLKAMDYIFEKIKETRDFLKENNIETFIEPGRFFASPSIKLVTEIIQIQEKNIIINTTIYNCALDTLLTGTKMLVEGELEDNKEGEYFLIKGNSPTRDDIFRYKVRLKNPKIGDKIIFLNAGAYNYTTDFFGYRKIKIFLQESF
ncbi:MAG: decarboxylase [Candidatus Pacearchaeota archaeon]|jgi:ornithine decarboxylase